MTLRTGSGSNGIVNQDGKLLEKHDSVEFCALTACE
jgi:hypothetical protein